MKVGFQHLVLIYGLFLAGCGAPGDNQVALVGATAAVGTASAQASDVANTHQAPVTPVTMPQVNLSADYQPATAPAPTQLIGRQGQLVGATSLTMMPLSPKPPITPLPIASNMPDPVIALSPESMGTPATTATPAVWPTVTRQMLPLDIAAGLEPCALRVVVDDPLAVVTQQFGLPESYVPQDLVPISEHFEADVTLRLNTSVRALILEPLIALLRDMHLAGLRPSILSGYRSYGEQYLAWKWWNSQYPERVAIMSARAGHSEHQLGTTVDFGSPALDHLFHVDFADTPEGVWLRENAYRYGFTLSYPTDSHSTTGFKYEPWHFRYVGVELSTALQASRLILTTWQLNHLPSPCNP